MKTLLSALAVAALTAALALPANAQEKSVGVLTVGKGTVMTSKGGEFNPATSGQPVQVGDRIMLAENSAATVSYPGCTAVSFTQPGVYTIKEPAVCRESNDSSAGSGVADSGVPADSAAFIAFEAAIVAAGLASSMLDDDEDLVDGAQPPQPISH